MTAWQTWPASVAELEPDPAIEAYKKDIDVVYSRLSENLDRLVSALAPFDPYLRGAPPGLPFEWNSATVQRGVIPSLQLQTVGHP